MWLKENNSAKLSGRKFVKAMIVNLLSGILLISVGSYADDINKNLLFSVPFKRNNDVNAEFAKDKKKPKSLGGPIMTKSLAPKTKWEPELGFVTGRTNQAIEFPAKGNINPKLGTISLWIQGDNWKLDDKIQDVFFVLEGSKGKLTFLRDKPGVFALVSEVNGKSNRCEANLKFDSAQIRFFTITYGADGVSLYLDGRKVVSQKDFPLPVDFERIIIGQKGQGKQQSDKWIDNFKIFNRELTPAEIAKYFYAEGKFALHREAAVLQTDRKITIDGKIDPKEWSDAAKLTGLVHSTKYAQGPRLLSEDQTWFYVTYDDKNLYVAMDSPVPEKVRRDLHMTAGMGGLLKISRKKHDVDVDADDAFEVNVVVPRRNGGLYRMVCNGLDTTYDYTVGGDSPESPVQGIDINWEPKWEVANTVNVDTWQVEARIPFKDIVNVSFPKPGTEWGMNFIRIWKKLRTEGSSWSDGWRLIDDRSLVCGAYAKGLPGAVKFLGKKGLEVRLDSVGLPDYGKLNLKGTILCKGAGRKATVTVTSNSNAVNETKEIEIPENGRIPFNIEKTFRDPTTTVITLSVKDAKTGENALFMEIPVAIKQAVTIASRSYPSFGVYKVEINLTGLSDIPLDKLRAVILMRNSQTGKVEAKKIVRKFKAYQQNEELDIRRIPDGKYEVQVVVFEKDKAVITQTMEFNKKPKPEWFGNTIGNSDTPPYPFEPIIVKGSTVNVWERKYEFKKELYPAQVTVLGRKLLRGPIAVIAQDENGKPMKVSVDNPDTDWILKSKVKVEGVRKGKAGPFNVSNCFWMEYDGFLWSRLVVSTKSDKKLKLLKMEIPFTKEFSDVINPYDYSLRETGKLKPEGWSGAIRPVWVGNALGGLQWLAEHDGPWSVKDRQKEIQVKNGPKGATMIITFVDKPVDVSMPLELEFGMVVTPVKESKTVDYRAPIIEWNYAWYSPGHEFGAGIDAYTQKSLTPNKFIRDYTINDKIRKKYQYPSIPNRYQKMYCGPYVTTMRVMAGTDDFDQFGDEWYMEENARYIPKPGEKGSISVSQNSKSFQDYFVYKYWQLMQKSPFASLYYDVSGEATGLNLYGGLGYQKLDGTKVSSSAILGTREIARRMYTMVKEKYPDAIIKWHNSGMINMAFLSFCDYFVEGECTINMLTQDRKDYRGKIRPDTYRAEMMGHNFGFVTDFLYQYTRSGMWTYDSMRKAGPDIVDHIFGQTLLHDTQVWAAYAPVEFALRWQRALARHNWGMQYEMIPYWKQKIVKLPRKDLFATFYVEKPTDRVICIFYNDSDWEGELKLKLDWKALGFDSPKDVKIENAAHSNVELAKKHPSWKRSKYKFSKNPKEYAKIEGDAIVFPMTKYNYRMIVLYKTP